MTKFGVSVAMLTPFEASGALDLPRLAAHATRMLHDGAQGVTLYGTTGEGASIGMAERAQGIDGLRAAGIAPDRITLGLYAPAVADAAAQIAQGLAAGIQCFLLPPPFYFRGAPEAGLLAWLQDLLAATDPRARFILYHIPQITGVPLPPTLVAELHRAAPERIRGLKDSSGSWESAQAFLEIPGPEILIGDERLLHRAVALGGAGAISGMANLYPARLARIVETAEEDRALSAEVDKIVATDVIPAIKTLQARATGDATWERLRPPLQPLAPEIRERLLAETSV